MNDFQKSTELTLDISGLTTDELARFTHALEHRDLRVTIVRGQGLFAMRNLSYQVRLADASGFELDKLLALLKQEFSRAMAEIDKSNRAEAWLRKPDGDYIPLHFDSNLAVGLEHRIRYMIDRFYQQRAIDPAFRYHIETISLHHRLSPYYGTTYPLVRILVSTNNESLFHGQFAGVPMGGIVGLFTHYLRGAIERFLSDQSGLDNAHVFFDVSTEAQDPPPADRPPQRNELVTTLIKRGVISKRSMLSQLATKHNLDYVGLIGLDFSGPVPGMLLLLEKLLEQEKPRSLLDLFAGTGGYTKLILQQAKACEATLLDILPMEAAKNQLMDFGKRCQFLEQDIAVYSPARHFDWIIADPYDYMALSFAKDVIPRLSLLCNVLVTSICYAENRSYARRVRQHLEARFRTVEMLDLAEITIALCRNS